MLDRNKTQATHDVTDATISYLGARGFKPVETEAMVAKFGVVDIAGVCEPTPTEAIDLKLIGRRPRWKASWYLDKPNQEEMDQYQRDEEAWKAAYNAIPSPMTIIVEVKTSRSDFFADKSKWALPSPAHLRYIATPQAMLKASEYPAGWGILEVQCCSSRLPTLDDSSTTRVFHATVSPIHQPTVEQTLQIVLEIAMRQYNNIHYANHRERMKEYRIEQTERVSRTRWTDAFKCMLDITNGGNDFSDDSVERVLAMRRVTLANLPEDVRNGLCRLWGVARQNGKQ